MQLKVEKSTVEVFVVERDAAEDVFAEERLRLARSMRSWVSRLLPISTFLIYDNWSLNSACFFQLSAVIADSLEHVGKPGP